MGMEGSSVPQDSLQVEREETIQEFLGTIEGLTKVLEDPSLSTEDRELFLKAKQVMSRRLEILKINS
jgi:hypothetical protein